MTDKRANHCRAPPTRPLGASNRRRCTNLGDRRRKNAPGVRRKALPFHPWGIRDRRDEEDGEIQHFVHRCSLVKEHLYTQ